MKQRGFPPTTFGTWFPQSSILNQSEFPLFVLSRPSNCTTPYRHLSTLWIDHTHTHQSFRKKCSLLNIRLKNIRGKNPLRVPPNPLNNVPNPNKRSNVGCYSKFCTLDKIPETDPCGVPGSLFLSLRYNSSSTYSGAKIFLTLSIRCDVSSLLFRSSTCQAWTPLRSG